jgi:hypothetical protein
MTTIHFSEAAAQDALARSDDGDTPLPGDDHLIAAYETYLQQAQYQYEAAQQNQVQTEWLALQCPGCHEGGTGEPCDEHHDQEG